MSNLADDLVSDRADRSAELRSYGRMVRVLGRPVPQPEPSALAPVVLVPGFVSGDVSLTVLARTLRRAGHRTFGGRIGANLGCTEDMVGRLLARVEAVGAAEGRPVALVGHSRGGMITKLVAQRRPDLVAALVVLAAPVTGELVVAAHVRRQLEALFRLHRRGLERVLGEDCVTGECAARVAAELAGPFPASVRYTSVWSARDAIIDHRTCLDPAAELVEAGAGHSGMGTDPAVARIVVAALAAGPLRSGDGAGVGTGHRQLP
jgi:triacylglycerol lipase